MGAFPWSPMPRQACNDVKTGVGGVEINVGAT